MNAEQLLQHFERISEAPDAIKRLRRFILDLAVRGKLVEQDPEDEPAEEMLYRIRQQKKRMVISGEIKKAKEDCSASSLLNNSRFRADGRHAVLMRLLFV